MNKEEEKTGRQEIVKNIRLLDAKLVHLKFHDTQFEVVLCNQVLTISLDENNFCKINLKNQQVSYKATILGGFALSEEKIGTIDYQKYIQVVWDDQFVPMLIFKIPPLAIRRDYNKGQQIELGIEDVPRYHVVYKDNVMADFTKINENAFDFSFSTGFTGKIWKDPDGSHSIQFKGLRIDADKDGYNSESKFIISRSKYTDNLVLILQDDASVFLKS